jgi:hypothetical protein
MEITSPYYCPIIEKRILMSESNEQRDEAHAPD